MPPARGPRRTGRRRRDVRTVVAACGLAEEEEVVGGVGVGAGVGCSGGDGGEFRSEWWEEEDADDAVTSIRSMKGKMKNEWPEMSHYLSFFSTT